MVGARSPKAMAGLNFAWVLKYFYHSSND
jgi:hypothetical protein